MSWFEISNNFENLADSGQFWAGWGKFDIHVALRNWGKVPQMVVFKTRARIQNRSETLHMIEYLHVKFRQDSDYSNFTLSTINGTNVYSI